MPGFETLQDGSTRVFVDLSGPVSYETRSSRGTMVYVLKGAHVGRRNNLNPLVTEYFNTPISAARLVPHGSDLWLVLSMRAKVSPTVTADSKSGGGATLSIVFAQGDYLPAAMKEPVEESPAPISVAAPAAPPPASSAAPTPRALPGGQPHAGGHSHGGGGHSHGSHQSSAPSQGP